MGNATQDGQAIDWASVNLATSISIIVASFFHTGMRLLRLALPAPVFANLDAATRSVAIAVFDYGVPFAVALLVVRALGLAEPLRRARVFFWVLVLCNVALLALMMSRLAIGTLASRELRQVAGVLFWAYQSLIVVPALLGIAATWIRVLIGLVLQWRRERPRFRSPVPSEFALAFLFGLGLPAAAMAPLFPGAQKYHERYAAQEARLAEVCKGTKLEIFETATSPKSVYFDPDRDQAFWDVRDGRFGSSSGGIGLGESLAAVGPLAFAEFWYEPYKKPRELRRCDSNHNCETVSSITAKYRVLGKDTQTKVDKALGVFVRTIIVDERETGRILGRLQFAHAYEIGRICAPVETAKIFEGRTFMAKVLGVKPKLTEEDLARHGGKARGERELEHAAHVILRTDAPLDAKADQAEFFNSRCWSRTILNKELDLALKDCNRAMTLVRDPALFDSRGLVYYRLGRYREAIADFDKAIAQNPELVGSLYVRGLAKRRAGDIAGGDRDIAAAKAKDVGIAEQYAAYGVTP